MNTKLNACEPEVIYTETMNRKSAQIPEQQTLKKLSDLYKVFSDHTRLQILWVLECNEICVCDLAALLNMTTSAVSHQLRVLRYVKLVTSRRDGKNVYYSLADNHVKDIILRGLEHVNE